MQASRIGDAFWIRLAGLALIAAVATGMAAVPRLAVAGALAVAASSAPLGHSMLHRPRQGIAALVVVHLACVSFWVGSLLPLARLARGADPEAPAILAAWSSIARPVVVVLVASGALLAALMVRRLDQPDATRYGLSLAAKLAFVAAMLALAARREPEAGQRLARSIHTRDAGHRVAS